MQDYAKQLSRFDGPDLYQADRIIRGFRREQLISCHPDAPDKRTL